MLELMKRAVMGGSIGWVINFYHQCLLIYTSNLKTAYVTHRETRCTIKTLKKYKYCIPTGGIVLLCSVSCSCFLFLFLFCSFPVLFLFLCLRMRREIYEWNFPCNKIIFLVIIRQHQLMIPNAPGDIP